jgi:hypothetical protein
VTKPPRHRLAFPIALTLAALTASCGGDVTLPEEGEAAELEILDGNEQVGPVGTALADPLVVRVTDTQNRPVPNQEVTFLIESGGGSLEPETFTTGSDGLASTSWTLGPGAGGQQVRARTPRGGGSSLLEVMFTGTAVPGSGSVLVSVDGDEQSGPVSSALADSLVVRTTDALGNPVANIEVTWSVGGGGSVSPVTVVTDVDGLAATERVLGPTAGAQTAQAAVEGFTGSPITFTHTAVPANPTALVLISGDDQTAPGGFEVAQDLVVRLEDPNGNGIGGRPITWVVPTGSGSVTPVSTTTNVNGLAATRWTLPSPVGEYTVNAVFSGLPPVVFSATSTADAPTTIAMVSGNGQSAAAGAAVTNPLVVRVTDINDNPVANVSVTWTAVGGGTVSQENTPTNAQGLAQVSRTLGPTPGQYTTTAAVDGLEGSPITFVSTATAGAPAQLALATQPGSPTVSGAAFNPVPAIQVQDAQGNPVAQGGIIVLVTIDPVHQQAGASLENDSRNTNSNGRAGFQNLRITGPPDDDYVLTFTATFNSVVLTPVSTGPLVVTAGGAARLVLLTQPSSSAQSGVPFAQQPVVQVQDATGNPLTGSRTITASIGDGGGTLIGGVTATTGTGSTATFDDLGISGTIGSRTLIFSSGALTPAESSPINLTTGPAEEMAIQAGDGQTAPVNTVLPTDPSVIIRDSGGNPVAGVEVTFTASNGGSASPSPVTTGANGMAATNWTLGPTAGENELTASAPSIDPVTFEATGSAAGSTTSLDVSPASPVTAGDNITFTATVAGSGPTPTGTVEFFMEGNVSLGSGTLSGGQATVQSSTVPEGTHSFTAVYSGDATYSGSTSAAVTGYTVNPPPPPVVGSDNFTVDEDGTLTEPAPGVLANDSDPNGAPVTAQIVDQAEHGTVSLSANGGFTYDPDPDFNGPDGFSYRASNGQAQSDLASVSLTVTAVNDLPIFSPGPTVEVSLLEAVGYSSQWATGVDPGPPDEIDQELEFVVGLNPADSSAFLNHPQISETGTLNFTVNPLLILTQSRDFPVTVVLREIASGLATEPVTFTIRLNP